MGDGYTLKPATMTTVAGDLTDVGSRLAGGQGSLTVTPDAGQSRAEVAKAFAGLGAALAALAETAQEISGNITDAVAAYRASDTRAGHGFTPTGTP